MDEYKISINLESNCLLGSGEGWGSVVDTDIVFDSIGLPYFPARRLKGCIKESAEEVLEIMNFAGVSRFGNGIIRDIFGSPGDSNGANVIFNNLHLSNYKEVALWCSWALQELKGAVSNEVIVNSFTNIRQQISIDKKGIAEDKSLRTLRVLKSGLKFEGIVTIRKDTQDVIDLLAFSCANLRYVGTMRNRGFGKVKCTFEKENDNLLKICIEQLEKEVM